MKIIEVDDELYQYIASQTQHIGESASEILRRLLLPTAAIQTAMSAPQLVETSAATQEGVDTVHSLHTADFIDDTALQAQQDVVGRFLYILSALHVQSPVLFQRVLDVRGRNRLYFATSKESLLAAGSSTNPKLIPDSGYWVVSNNNTNKKRAILDEVCDALGVEPEVKTYLIDSL